MVCIIKQKITGLLALDIDGTLTHHREILDKKVIIYLEELAKQGWQILFVTGRTFSWSIHLLEQLKFHYFLAPHNGALIVEMPKKYVIARNFLSKKDLLLIDKEVRREGGSCVVFTGIDHGDLVYVCPSEMSEESLSYLKKRAKSLKENWAELLDFKELPIENFASIRIFERPEKVKKISKLIEALGFDAPPMTDSFDPSYSIVQVTQSGVSKGFALEEIVTKKKITGTIIAAGDDYNDISMLKKAEIRIVMQNAPDEVKVYADIIAQSAGKLGIIEGLKEAISISQGLKKQ